MKQLSFILVVLLFCGQTLRSQVVKTTLDPADQKMYEYHLTKRKKLNKAGFILLGTGVAASVAGALIINNSNLNDGFAEGSLLFIGGVLSTTASIPVFIIAGSQRSKAEALVHIGNHPNEVLALTDSQYVSVGFKIDF